MIDYNPKKWWRVALQLRGTVAIRIWPRTLMAAGIGGLSAWLFVRHQVGLPPLAHTLVGVALGLLLVFRTNASYDRYWEGRRLLGAMVNRSRDLARQVAAFAPQAEHAELGRWIGLLYALIRMHLRGERDLAPLGERVRGDERPALEAARTPPCLVAGWLSRRLAALARDGRLGASELMLIDANLTAQLDALGGAERILRTPIPFAYAQHIKAFLALFVFSCPFAMADAMGWYTPIAAGVIAFALFGIDEIGVEIEDPFGYDPNDLPLDRIGDTIDADVAALLASTAGEQAEARVATASAG
jgi:putative membrane protein